KRGFLPSDVPTLLIECQHLAVLSVRRKSRNRINLNSGLLFEILVKHWISYLMSAFREKISIEVEGFFKQQGAGSTIQSNDIEHVCKSQSKR
ncbi:hypothetical protein H5410_061800, partial [Solanum commersonii]